MRGHNICFHSEIRKIISELSLFLLLIWSSELHYTSIEFVYHDTLDLKNYKLCFFFYTKQSDFIGYDNFLM